jgi:F-type H+-transporting ATPase subunit delta
MAVSTSIARRYAEAYFALARDAQDIDGWRRELERAVETLSNEEVARALRNPKLALADRVKLAENLLDGSSAAVRNLVRLLIERKRADIAGGLLAEYDRLADRSRGVVHVEVISAYALDAASRKNIEAALARQVKGTARTVYREDPAIIGGLVLRIDDRVIDDSLRTHLQQLQAALAS